jgi:phosphoribosylformylglycinamidine synthase subunit PurQ / glutaminase
MTTKTQPKALILHANGINRDEEAAVALEAAGALPEIIHINQLRAGTRRWRDYQMLLIPGGFSYADALGGGKLMALDLNVYFADAVGEFVESGKPVLGICNGFQALVKAGILPGATKPATISGKKAAGKKTAAKEPSLHATLTFNEGGRFECRWVTLKPSSRKCIWTRGLEEPIYCPVAHGEGRFMAEKPDQIKLLQKRDQIAVRYIFEDGTTAAGAYPENPNGSADDIAGICNERGNVMGLMPHPEDHIHAWQHPRHTRGEAGRTSLGFFENGVRYAAEI